jgi:hypothetical protein
MRHTLCCLLLVALAPACTIPTIGSPCEEEADCGIGLHCRKTEHGQFCTAFCWHDASVCPNGYVCASGPGYCVKQRIEGETCVQDYECYDNLVCNDGTDPARCLSPGHKSAVCGEDGDCLPSLRCDNQWDGGICVELLGEGERCASYDDCSSGLSCQFGRTPSVCMAPGEHGAHCTGDSQCVQGLHCEATDFSSFCTSHCDAQFEANCPDGFACIECIEDADASCVPIAKRNEECQWHDQCEADLMCNWAVSPRICVPPGGVGGLCNMDAECEAGLYCDDSLESPSCMLQGETGDSCKSSNACSDVLTCLIDQEAGGVCVGPCTTHAECPSGTYCIPELSDYCRFLGVPDELCLADLHCEPGLVCVPFRVEQEWTAACFPPLPEGSPCTTDEQCEPELECDPEEQICL